MKNTKKLITLFTACIAAGTLSAGIVHAEEATLPTTDRSGKEISVPDEITKVICLAPSTAQILEELGVSDLLVAVDTQTPYYMEETAELPQFDMMNPDCETILSLDPDIVFITGMSYIGSDDPYAELAAAGICVAEIPSSESIDAIKEDILFVSECFGMKDEGTAIVDEMDAAMEEVRAIGETITEKKTVLFEIACLPNIYSFGSGAFLDEMIQIIGAENIFADRESWIAVTEESAIAANPDVILTSVNYIEDPIGEILSREGWEGVTAVKEAQVYSIDNAASSLPNQNIITALYQMAKAVYPEAYADLAE